MEQSREETALSTSAEIQKQPLSWRQKVMEGLRTLFAPAPVVYISDPSEPKAEIGLPVEFAKNVARMHGKQDETI